MTKLSSKVFFILLPLAVSILGFGYAYYDARKALTLNHIFRSVQLSVSLGESEISHYIEGQFTEFDRLSSAVSLCEEPSPSLSELSSDALSYTNGFSALLITDLLGKVVNFQLSSNKSNRYVLRQDLKNARILPPEVIVLLQQSYEEWRINYPRNIAIEQEASAQLNELQEHGEENSQASRELSSKLNKIRKNLHFPKLVINLAETEITSRLGLIFDNETYFYSRPMIDCQQQLVGYYTAVIDRTLIEDQLFEIKRSLTDNGLEYVDVFVVRNEGVSSLSNSNYIRLDQLQRNGLNPTSGPMFRQDLGGVVINRPIGVETKHQWYFDGNINPAANMKGISLVVFVSDKELQQHNNRLIREVALYLTLAMVLFTGLTLYLAHYIASPISDLRRRLAKLSLMGDADTDYKVRGDEIGELFDAFSDMATKIKQRESQLTRLAREDPLTGVLNRRAFFEQATRLEQSRKACAIAMMDLDHFKSVNDCYGHAVGDRVLIAFCAAVNQETRESDIFGRLGGEEFALIFPDTSVADTAQIMRRIRIRVESELAQATHNNASHPITVSIGIANWPVGVTFNQALAAADNCLYQAKNNGRNQVVVD